MARKWNGIKIPGIKNREKLPVFLAREEVRSLLQCIQNLNHRAILTTIYSGGLRISETAHLKASDIDSKTMMIRVQGGKGNKDRYTLAGNREAKLAQCKKLIGLDHLQQHEKESCKDLIARITGIDPESASVAA